MFVSAAASAADPDPRELFERGDYAAAAAGFEKRWNATGDAVDGLNAVVAWRNEGHYAHARVMVDHLLRSKPPLVGELKARAEILADKLDMLTARIALVGPNVTNDVVARIDGQPAERLGDDYVTDVGKADLVVDKPACTSFKWAGQLMSRQRVELPLVMECPKGPGNLHIHIDGPPKATATVDGHDNDVEYDLDLRMPAGAHAVSVVRENAPLLRETLTIEAAETTKRTVVVPLRAMKSSLVVGVYTSSVVTTFASSAAAGIGFGLVSDLEFHVAVGKAVSTADHITPGTLWFLLDVGGFPHLLRPLAHGHAMGGLWTLDWKPLFFSAQAAQADYGRDGAGAALLVHISAAPLVLSAGFSFVDFELALSPIGISLYNLHESPGQETPWATGYSAGLSLNAYYPFFSK